MSLLKNFDYGGDFMRHVHGGNIYANKCEIDFSANMNPLGIPNEVKEAFLNAVEGIGFYPDPDCLELRSIIAEKEKVDFSKIICSNGADELIFALCFALRPKKALLAAPCFAEYEQALVSCGCEVEIYKTLEENNFRTGNDFLEKIDGNTDIVFFTNPSNPVGNVYGGEYIKSLIERCRNGGAYIVVDECFMDFISDGDFRTAKNFIDYEKLIILKAFTKFYAIPGLRLGYGIFSSEETAERVRGAMQTWNVSYPAQKAGVAALKCQIKKETLELVEREKRYLVEEMRNLAVKIYGCGANFIFFKADADFGKNMLKNGILVRNCGNYYPLTEEYYRIAVRTHDENKRLIETWKKIKGGV